MTAGLFRFLRSLEIRGCRFLFRFTVEKSGGLFLCSLFFFFLACYLLLFYGCSVKPIPQKGVRALVTVAPIAGLVKEVAGDIVPVTVLVPAGKEPETFMPTPSDMLEIAGCTVFFRVGLSSEEAVLERLKNVNPNLRVIDLRDNLPILNFDEGISEEEEGEDPKNTMMSGGEEHHHHHHPGESDPHIWMSLENLRLMAETISGVLSEEDPDNQEIFAAKSEAFQKRADDLHQEITEKLGKVSSRTIFVFHPAYGWYCYEFDLKQRAVESGGKSPKSKDLVDLIHRLEKEKAGKIFVQPEFSRSAADKIAESLHIQVEVHSPLGEDPFLNITGLTEAILR